MFARSDVVAQVAKPSSEHSGRQTRPRRGPTSPFEIIRRWPSIPSQASRSRSGALRLSSQTVTLRQPCHVGGELPKSPARLWIVSVVEGPDLSTISVELAGLAAELRRDRQPYEILRGRTAGLEKRSITKRIRRGDSRIRSDRNSPGWTALAVTVVRSRRPQLGREIL